MLSTHVHMKARVTEKETLAWFAQCGLLGVLQYFRLELEEKKILLVPLDKNNHLNYYGLLWCSHSMDGRTRLGWHWPLGMGTRSGSASQENYRVALRKKGGIESVFQSLLSAQKLLFKASKRLFNLQTRSIIGVVLCVNISFSKLSFIILRPPISGQCPDMWIIFFHTLQCIYFLSTIFSHLLSPIFPTFPPASNPSPLLFSFLSMCSDYLSKLAISWLLYRDDVSLCPRVHQVGFLPLYLVKPKLTAGLVGVLLDLTKGLGLVLMRVNPVWFIAGLSKKINGSPFESKSFIALCTYVSSLWIFFPIFYLLLYTFSISHSLILILPLCPLSVFIFFPPPIPLPNPICGNNLPMSVI